MLVAIFRKCPKCGRAMGPPRYCKSCAREKEHLHRTCNTCGYETKEPCADAPARGTCDEGDLT